jgi:hypothetical protein
LTAFFYFGASRREEATAQHKKVDAKTLGEEWKALDDAAKKTFADLAEKDKERYKQEKAAYETKKIEE